MVVEDRVNYVRDGEEHLQDTTIYVPVENDPTGSLVNSINDLVGRLRGKGYLSADMAPLFLHPRSS